MPPATRSQTSLRKAVAKSDAPPITPVAQSDEIAPVDQHDGGDAFTSVMHLRQDASTGFAAPSPPPPHRDNQPTETSSTRSSTSSKRRRPRPSPPNTPPHFTIDLSLPPEQRYLAVCAAFQAEIAELVPLFDEVVGGMLHFVPLKWVHRACRLLLRGVYDGEEQAELRGISKTTGVSIYLLVCFNVLLDLFMGCSSGGAAVRDGNSNDGKVGEGRGTKMVHFRTLDWGMPSLRRVVVQLDFVLEKDGPVLASSITYAGYVGVLTGVREGLSMSLNFRPNRIDNGLFWSDAKYVWHLLCVVTGWRRSISSTLRGFLVPRRRTAGWLPFGKATQGRKEDLLDYAGTVNRMGGDASTGKRPITTTACYFCVCNGKETTIIEKDRISAKVRSGDEFLVVTNTDESPPSTPAPTQASAQNDKTSAITSSGAAVSATAPASFSTLEEMLDEAKDRQECAFHNWRNLHSTRARELSLHHISGDGRKRLATMEDVVELVQKYPTTNECTHFAAVMDPAEGSVVWCRRWKEPVGARWIRAHMSGAW